MLRFAIALLTLSIGAFPADAARTTTCFVPGEDCTGRIVREIDNASRQVLVQAYGFTSCPIIEALLRAKERGLNVRVLLDRSNEQRRYAGAIATLLAHGIEPKIDHIPSTYVAPDGMTRVRGIAHIKAIILDERVVITGSMNFTWCGQHCNVENVLFVPNKRTAREHILNWRAREALARGPMIGPGIRPACNAAPAK
jgi:phosphatidylserine/phosphatidylglycerophosphate/cardiolipin synthase-like enzyme